MSRRSFFSFLGGFAALPVAARAEPGGTGGQKTADVYGWDIGRGDSTTEIGCIPVAEQGHVLLTEDGLYRAVDGVWVR